MGKGRAPKKRAARGEQGLYVFCGTVVTCIYVTMVGSSILRRGGEDADGLAFRPIVRTALARRAIRVNPASQPARADRSASTAKNAGNMSRTSRLAEKLRTESPIFGRQPQLAEPRGV